MLEELLDSTVFWLAIFFLVLAFGTIVSGGNGGSKKKK